MKKYKTKVWGFLFKSKDGKGDGYEPIERVVETNYRVVTNEDAHRVAEDLSRELRGKAYLHHWEGKRTTRVEGMPEGA